MATPATIIQNRYRARLAQETPQNDETEMLVSPQYLGDNLNTEVRRTRSRMLPQLNDRQTDLYEMVNAGDVDAIVYFLQKNADFDLNCVDYKGHSALVTAIIKQNPEVVEILLGYQDLITVDTLMHAVKTGNCTIAKMLLDKFSDSRMYLAQDPETASFPTDYTPLKLACLLEDYKMIDMLLQHGHFMDRPHPPSCFCEEKCKDKKMGESFTVSKSRLNSYEALCSCSYICQTATDPILTAFELCEELKECAAGEQEYTSEYKNLAEKCSDMAVSILAQCRDNEELDLVLHRKEGFVKDVKASKAQFARVGLALLYDQKKFVAHPNCQQVLRGAWLADWQDWVSLTMFAKIVRLLPRIVFLPIICLSYIVAPKAKFNASWRTPINKFFSFVASYIIFLAILFFQNISSLEKSYHRGMPNSGLELSIVLYIVGLGWMNVKMIFKQGFQKYITQKWNKFTLVMLFMFASAIAMWCVAEYDARQTGTRDVDRKKWNQFDPTLIAEGFNSLAIIMAFIRILYIFQIGDSIGPLLISLSRMFGNITIFMEMFLVVIVSFSIGMSTLYHYYKDQKQTFGGDSVEQNQAFISWLAALINFYWALFGLTPPQYCEIILGEYESTVDGVASTVVNKHRFTMYVGFFIYGVYEIAAPIICLNMLIAMMSDSFSNVQENADVEWKVSRTKVWFLFFDTGMTLPPPFNLIPTPKTISKIFAVCCGRKGAKCSITRCCYYDNKEVPEELEGIELGIEEDEAYQLLMDQLIQRLLSEISKKKKVPTATLR